MVEAQKRVGPAYGCGVERAPHTDPDHDLPPFPAVLPRNPGRR